MIDSLLLAALVVIAISFPIIFLVFCNRRELSIKKTNSEKENYKKFLIVDIKDKVQIEKLDKILLQQILLSNEENFELSIFQNKDIILQSLERLSTRLINDLKTNLTISLEDIETAKNKNGVSKIDITFSRLVIGAAPRVAGLSIGNTSSIVVRANANYLKKHLYIADIIPTNLNEAKVCEKISELID